MRSEAHSHISPYKSKYFTKVFHRFQDVSTLWLNFKHIYTYLIFDEKHKFLRQLSKLTKHPWYYRFRFKLYKKLKALTSEALVLKENITFYNDYFVRERLANSPLFKTAETLVLSEEQKKAIIIDDKHNLVIGGAGSGKTRTITTRIAYLVQRKDNVAPDKILALAYTNVAADEMRQRLQKKHGIDIDISTFHALGYKIIRDHTNQRPQVCTKKEKDLKIRQFILEALQDKKFKSLFLDYLAYYFEEELKEQDFQEKEKYFTYMNEMRYTTLNNKTVQSISERNIANFLFIHNIDFEYERLVDWADKDEEDKQYHPDFYLPEYDVYIEHWGLSAKGKEGQVPEWFSITSEEYKKERQWKLGQYQKHNKILIETWEFERHNGLLLANLEQNLISTIPLISLTPKTYEELIEHTHLSKQREIERLIAFFIQIAKSNMLSEKKIRKRLSSQNFSIKQKLFARISLEIFKRYQAFLKKEHKIDFNDMINGAVKIIHKYPRAYLNRYDHVLIDEFQDISFQRLQLIRGFVNQNSDTKLFCVGDDWQSIYQFTGSNLGYFTEFEHIFPHPAISILHQNYRSSQKIVAMSNDLIANNLHQIFKKTYSENGPGEKPILFVFHNEKASNYNIRLHYMFKFIEALISQGAEPEDIMVLSRFTYILNKVKMLCASVSISIQEEVNGVVKRKGVRFYSAHKSKGSEAKYVLVIELTAGTYGFPCEIRDSSVFKVVQMSVKQNYIEEERRLFYVALTRSKKYLFLFSIQDKESLFLAEIKPYVQSYFIRSPLHLKNALTAIKIA